MDELQDLYQDIILSHNKRPRNEGVLEPHTHEAEGFNPLCGDRIRVFLRIAGGVVEGISFVGDGCAISRASASIMTERLRGTAVGELGARVREIVEMLSGEDDPHLAALAGVRKFPARIKCATLAWHAAEEAGTKP